MARIRDTDEVTDTRTLTGAVTVVGVFASGSAARAAIRSLERSGFPADRVGIVDDNVRNAREVAGSFSPQGALVGAMLGALLTAAVIVFGGESIRQNPASIALGGLVLIVAFTAIGWLAGRGDEPRRGRRRQREGRTHRRGRVGRPALRGRRSAEGPRGVAATEGGLGPRGGGSLDRLARILASHADGT